MTPAPPAGEANAANDAAWVACMLALLAKREPASTACPSEVARQMFPDHWRANMDTVRRLAAQLSREGTVDILQKGQVLPPDLRWKEPIRIRLHKPDRDPS